MAAAGTEEDNGGISLDIDHVHMLLQVEHEQIQRRTFTNWINAQLSKRCPPSSVSDLFSEFRDGSQLLDLLEVMSGQPMKRQKGYGVFQQRANIETALNFLKKKSIKLVNMNVSDIMEGRPSIILGLVWRIILHCHIEELAGTLSYSSCHSSLDSLASLDSWSGSSGSAGHVPGGRTSTIHRSFRVSAKKALLMWVRDQCQRAGCTISVRNFGSCWRSGEVFLAILCSIRPNLVDLSLVRSRSNQENLEEAFQLAEREFNIPRLLEPQDIDVNDPDEKSIITYVAQFLQYSKDMPAPDDHLELFPLAQPSFPSPMNFSAHFAPAVVSPFRQVSPVERATEVTAWLQQGYQELSKSRTATDNPSIADKYQVFHSLADSSTEQRKPVMNLLGALKRRSELSKEHRALRAARDLLEEELQTWKADLDSSLPPPLDSVVVWLQRVEAVLADERDREEGHRDAAKKIRAQQDMLKPLIKDLSHHTRIIDSYHNMDDMGNAIVPLEIINEIKRRLTNIRVTAKYQGLKLEYQESRHTALDLLHHVSVKVQTWKPPYRSLEAVLVLLQDWHETMERQGLLAILVDAFQKMKERANIYTIQAAPDSQLVSGQVKKVEGEIEVVAQAVTAVRGTLERVVSAWETYNSCMTSLQSLLAQKMDSQAQHSLAEDMSAWKSCQAKVNEAGNLLIEVTESSTSTHLSRELSKVNKQWAECMKRIIFEASSQPSLAPTCVLSLAQEASQLLMQPLEVASVPLKTCRQKLQLLSKKLVDVKSSSLSSSADFQTSNFQNLLQTLPQMVAEADRACGELQRAVSRVEGRLAELDHWSTEFLDCHQCLKEKQGNGCATLGPTGKVLFARGLQLERQLINEGQDLLDCVARAQKTSRLRGLSTSSLLDRMSKAISHCQEVIRMFSSFGFCRNYTVDQSEPGLLVMARTKHVDQVGNLALQTQDPKQLYQQSTSERSQQRTGDVQHCPKNQHMSTKDEPATVILHDTAQMLPQLLEGSELKPESHSASDQNIQKAEPLLQTSSLRPNKQLPADVTQDPVELKSSKCSVLVVTSPVPKEVGSLSSSRPQMLKSSVRGQPGPVQNIQASLRPPAVVRSEVHSKAQSMARSRLEKARFRLQGTIQQAIKSFGGKDISKFQIKNKQKALNILQPAILEEFLGAVEGFGAFCSGPQLQDLTVLCHSVRDQWEDVRREIVAFIPILWAKVKQGEHSFPVVQCETQTNEATDRTDLDRLPQQQAIVVRDVSAEERVKSLQELSEMLRPIKSPCFEDEAQETQPSDAVPPYDRRGQQLQGVTPPRATSVSANLQRSNSLPQEPCAEEPQRDLSPKGPRRDVLQAQAPGVSTESLDDVQGRGCGSRGGLKPALRREEQPLIVRLLQLSEGNQQTHIQAVVRSSSVETRQAVERTVFTVAAPQEERSSGQEVLERYRKSCLVFQSQLEKNKQHLESLPDSLTTSRLENHEKHLQETERLWTELDFQHAQLPHCSHLMSKDERSKAERDWEQLSQQWRGQQMWLQSRMMSLGNSTYLIKSADDQRAIITDKLERIIKNSVDISSLTLDDPSLVSDLKEMLDGLNCVMRKISEECSKEEAPLCLTLHVTVHHLEQLRQQLEKAESAAQALDQFLATVREVKVEIATLPAKGNPGKQQNEAALKQRLHSASEQTHKVDSLLKAVDVTLIMDGTEVTCQDVVTSLSQQAGDIEKELVRAEERERVHPMRKEHIQSPVEIYKTAIEADSPQEQALDHPTLSWMGEKEMEAKSQGGDKDTKKTRQKEQKVETLQSEVLHTKSQGSRSQVKKEGPEEESLVQRRATLLGTLSEIKGRAEQLGPQELTLHALHQRTQALTSLESRLAGQLPELHCVRDASPQPGLSDATQRRELEDVWGEVTKAVTERLEQCSVLTERLKRFHCIRGELSERLQKADSTISEQASNGGKENLHRLYTKVQSTKTALSSLGGTIEEIRSVCRDFHTYIPQISACNTVSYDEEVVALRDRWLDISEKTDAHIEKLHLGLTLWDGALQLAADVESWTTNKLAWFAKSPTFHPEEDIRTLRSDIMAQEEKMEHFQQRATEIKVLLHSIEPPLELQVVETQIKKKIAQLRELVSEAKVSWQMVDDEGQITARMTEHLNSLQKIQDSHLTLSDSDVAAVCAKPESVSSTTGKSEARLQELPEKNVSCRQFDGADLKQDVEKTEERWTDKTIGPHESDLHTDEELCSTYLAQRHQARHRLEELKRRRAQLPSLFPWPGTAERHQACLLARQLQVETESLQSTLSKLAEHKSELAARTCDTILKDSSSDELESCRSLLMIELQGLCSLLEEGVSSDLRLGELLSDCNHKLTALRERMSVCQAQKESSAGWFAGRASLENLLQEVTDIEKDLLYIEILKDSIRASSTAEAQANLSQQVDNLQNHKGALDYNIRESLALLNEKTQQKVQRVDAEVSCIQTALKDLAGVLVNLRKSPDGSLDIRELKQKWYTIQDCDNRLKELAARVHDLKKSEEETISAEVTLTVDAVARELDSLQLLFGERTQECAENTANTVKQVISRLQKWSQTVQYEPSSSSQAALDEGFCLQQALCEVVADPDFLLNCLGPNMTEEFKKSASDALNESTAALAGSSKCGSQIHLSHVEVESGRILEEPGIESDATFLVSPDEIPVKCPFAPPFPSAKNGDNSEAEKKDNIAKTKGTQDVSKQDEFVPQHFECVENPDTFKPQTQRRSKKITLTPPKMNMETCFWLKDDPVTLKSDITLSGNNTEPFKPNPVPTVKSLIAQLDSIDPLQGGITSMQGPTFSAIAEDTTVFHSTCCVTPLVGSPETKPDTFPTSNTETVPATSQTFKAVTDVWEQEKLCGGSSQVSRNVSSVVLDKEICRQDMPGNDNEGSDTLTYSQAAQYCDGKLTVAASTQPPEKNSGLCGTLTSPESDETDLKILCSKNESKSHGTDFLPEILPGLENTELEEVKSVRAKSTCDDKAGSHLIMHNDALNSSKLCGSVAECQFTAAHGAATTVLHHKREAMKVCSHPEEHKMSSVLCTVAGHGLTQMQRAPRDSSQHAVVDNAQSTSVGNMVMAEGEHKETSEPASPESKVPERQDNGTLLMDQRDLKAPASLDDTEQMKAQREESMEPERKVWSSAPDLPAMEITGGSLESCAKCSMQDILSEIQPLVEKSNIINRRPHIDLNWYLQFSPDEPEIQLARTVQKVFACRYQPARLKVTEMAEQLQEAEDYRCCVLEQVAAMESMRAAKVCDPNTLKRVEGQWSAALLDASATVQVKATQLDQVKGYHKQMRIIRAFLEVLAVEKEKLSLNTLGSSAHQADKLHVLLQTMVQKKDMMEDLLHLSSQLSVHLCDAESSGALLAQLGDVQEEWRLLQGGIKRALQLASNSLFQYSLLKKEVEQLGGKIEALQKFDFQSHGSESTLEYVCIAADLKQYNQIYLHLQSQSDDLAHFSLGQKEKDDIKCSLLEVGSLLNVTKSKLDTSTYRCVGISSAKTNKQLKDLMIWAKQMDHQISVGQKLSLFPEEAHIQIDEMRKLKTDFWSRRSKIQEEEQIKDVASDVEKKEIEQVLKTTETVAHSLDYSLNTMKKNLEEREKILYQLINIDAWLAETNVKRDPCSHIYSISNIDIRKLEGELKSHKLATVELENQLTLVESMTESCREIAVGLSPGESRYLVNRLSGLWAELDGLIAHEKASSWEIEELIHERATSDEELSIIQTSLQKISTDLEQQRFPLTQESISTIEHLKQMLMEHQCEVQELQHCQEAKRSSMLCTIGELQDQCKTRIVNAFEQEKYLHLRRQMEESRDIAQEQIQHAKDKNISVLERFRLCQTLLVELPLVKTQCQETADQLEAIAQELYTSELEEERQRICQTVETLVSWEFCLTDDIKNLENTLMLSLNFSCEYPALKELFEGMRAELEGAKPVKPDEKAIDIALRRSWVIWRNLESGIRVLEGLAQKEKINLKNYKELYSLKDATKKACHLQMESLSQARESLKDYHWAARGAIGFLHNAEATFLTALGGFLHCTEEQKQTQQALKALEDGFQAHIGHLSELLPQQNCLSFPETEALHITILSQLVVGRAILEAQAQFRLESLKRCEIMQQSHKKCHRDIHQRLSKLKSKLFKCAAQHITSYDKCVAQQKTAKLLMKDLQSLSDRIEDLRAGCPMQGCGFGKDGEVGALWRHWVLLRRGIGLAMAHTQQREEEWKDISTGVEQCCGLLASLQADVPDFSNTSSRVEDPQELLAQAKMHQATLEQEEQALFSLEHRLEHALSLSSSQDPISPGPVGKTLVKIKENVKSLRERNLLVVAAAQAEERERLQVQEEIEEVEQHFFTTLPSLEACSNPCKQQELQNHMSTLKAKLKHIVENVQNRYTDIPADISRRLQDVHLSLHREEEKLMKKSNPVWELDSRLVELGSSLEKIKVLLEQRSPTVNEAQRALKHVWDELDRWHCRLMLLENEVQDLAEDYPDQAHQLIDQLTQPRQLYQDTAQLAEQRTAFLSKIPTSLQEFEGIVYSATCWFAEAQSWLSVPCCMKSARNLHNHAKSLQLVLDDSDRIQQVLQDFKPVLEEISAVCDTSLQQEKLDQIDQQVFQMQRKILEPLELFLQAVGVVDDLEAELNTIEKNIPKIEAILSSMDNSHISLTEHLHNRQVILANMQSMRRTLEDMERYKGELHLPMGAEESLMVFSQARLLLQPLQELQHLTEQQTMLLESQISEEGPGTATSSVAYKRETFEVSNSEEEDEEEEEEEENKSCYSSSSDTLTCSIPEDPEETLLSSHVQSKDSTEILPLSKDKDLESGLFSSEMETSAEVAETGLDSVESGSENVETALITMDLEADHGEALIPECGVAEPPTTADEDQSTTAIKDQPKSETLISDPHEPSLQAAAAVEDARVIPSRPTVTPLNCSSANEFVTQSHEDVSLCAVPCRDQVSGNVLKEENKRRSSQTVSVEESKEAQESPEAPTSSTGPGGDEEQLSWSQIYSQISEKLTTLNKVMEQHESPISSEDGGRHGKVPEREQVSTESAATALQRTRESIAMLRQIKGAAEGLHPGVSEELFTAVRTVVRSLDALTDLPLSPGVENKQLKLLQLELLSTEMVTLAELLSTVESESQSALSTEHPEVLRCLMSLQDCLHTLQRVFSLSHSQLTEELGITHQHQELSDQLHILDLFELGRHEIFSSMRNAPSLKKAESMKSRHLRENQEERGKLKQAARSLLQGITHLLELGEECMTEGTMSRVHSCSRLQAVLCRRKRLLQVLRSQLAFMENLFQRNPEALASQEDGMVQLEVRFKALEQLALEQEVASQRRIQEWSRWEANRDRLSRLLDDVEGFVSSDETEGDGKMSAQYKLDSSQQMLEQLKESQAAFGLLSHQTKMLQVEPEFAATVGHMGGTMELRWQSALRETEKEIQRCRKIQDSRVRFQTEVVSVSEWLTGASKLLTTWSNLAKTSDLTQECIHNHLIQLLDFFMETEAMSFKMASVRQADCPELRAQVSQLEVDWSQVNSDLTKIQDQLHQRLLAAWPPVKLLSNLKHWLKKMATHLNQEKEAILKSRDAAQFTVILQQCQALKAGMTNAQLLIDFLCQSGPRVVGGKNQALRYKHNTFAEKLGDIRQQWLHLEGELESQSREAAQVHGACAARERQLQCLRGSIEQQTKQLTRRKEPTSQTVALKTLLELEAVVSRASEVDAALQELKVTNVRIGKEEDHPWDLSFSGQTDSVYRACQDLCKQVEFLRPALQKTVEKWGCFERHMREASLHTTRVHCSLQHQPLLSLNQAEGYMDLLQLLQEQAKEGEVHWASVGKSYQSLQKIIHKGTVQVLDDQMEEEKKRFKDVVEELKNEQMNTRQTLSLWQKYSHLSDQCSLDIQNLWHQLEDLWRPSAQQDVQADIRSLQKLQMAAEDKQKRVEAVVMSSKSLVGRLGAQVAHLIQSETQLLSHDILLLGQVTSRKKESLQEDLEQQKRFFTQLEALEEQTQDIQNKMNAGLNDSETATVLSELSTLIASLVEVNEMSGCVTLNAHDAERVQQLSGQWVESMTHILKRNRELQAESLNSQSFQEKCKNLTSIQRRLEEEMTSTTPQSYSSLLETLTVHQRLEAEIMMGNQLLQAVLCHVVQSAEQETKEKRSELVAKVTCMRKSWMSCVALVGQSRSTIKEQLSQWKAYRRGLKLLWKLLGEVDPLLPPDAPPPCALYHSQSSMIDYQAVEDTFLLHSTLYAQTVDAGRHLCETMVESECQGRLQSELRAVQKAWEHSSSVLERRRDGVNTTVQKWSKCQDRITSITSELEELKRIIKQRLPETLQNSEDEEHIQKPELSLQRLAGGLRELATMKTDLSQYVTASDSAMLEQQLEQLHAQWEELCTKVSLHRQEIADRLNAWTIFNDKNKEFCDWLSQMENKVCHSGDLSIEEMVEKLKKDCMEEINLFSENKSHLKQLGEQLLLASDEAKQSQVHSSLQEVRQRWHNLFHHIEARVKKLKETLVTVQQLDKNMSNLRSWLSRIEAELSRPITYSVCHHHEIQRRLAEQQELQKDIEQHTEGVASVLSLCDVLLRDEDAAGGTEVEGDSLQETSRSLDQRWRTICTIALDRRLMIEETWRLWCKFLDDYSRFDDWLKMAERTAASPNSADVLYAVAKEELKKFEGVQRQVHERLTQLELVNNQYRRLARENRTDRASQLKAMVHEGNRRWDSLHRRVTAILRRLKYFTSQREEFEGTRESMLVWLTELDLQLTNVEHFSDSDAHHKIQQLNSFQKDITLTTERIDGLIVFGEGLIQKSSPQDAVLIEDELEELHSYCQEVFGRLVRFHQRLSQPPMIREEPEPPTPTFYLESSLELIGRPWLGRSQGSLPVTPTHLLTSPLERSGRETPVSVDSLPLEWDHTGDVGGSSSHEDEEGKEENEEEKDYFGALSASCLHHEPPSWQSQGDAETQEGPPMLASTPLKQGYLGLMSQCSSSSSSSIKDIKRVSLMLDEEEEEQEQPEELGLMGLTAPYKQSGVIERWQLLQAQPGSDQPAQELHLLSSDLDDITSWLESVIPALESLGQSDPAVSFEDMAAGAKELKEMQKKFAQYKSIMLSINLRAQEAPELQHRLAVMNQDWNRACTNLQQWDSSLRKSLVRCQEFHERLHSLLLWLAHAESRRYGVDVSDPDTPVSALQNHQNTLTYLREELQGRQTQQASLQALWSHLQPEEEVEDSDEAQEKLHVTGSKLKLLLRQVEWDLGALQQRLDGDAASDQSASAAAVEATNPKRSSSKPKSFFYRVLRAAFPLHLLLLFLLLLPCLIPLSESDPGCTGANNFARSFYPMLHYTNGPPPT